MLASQLAITIWDLSGNNKLVPYGGTTIKLFSSDCTLKQGHQKLKVWLNVAADGSTHTNTCSTVTNSKEINRLDSLVKQHATGAMKSIDWLDKFSFKQINELESRLHDKTNYLHIEFPQFDVPIIYSEQKYPQPDIAFPLQSSDPEASSDNVVERKNRRLTRGTGPGFVDPDVRPSAKTRDELARIMRTSPGDELGPEDKDRLWKFRHYLTRHKQALTKVVRAVAWDNPREAAAMVALLPRWTEVGVDDALELLGPGVTHPLVRAYAVDRLRKASDSELLLYLLQLVQALRFESEKSSKKSPLARFLVTRAASNPILANFFFWYITVEAADRNAPSIFKHVLTQFQEVLKNGQKKASDGDDNDSQHAVAKHDDSNRSVARPGSMQTVFHRQTVLVNKLTNLASEIKASKDPQLKKIKRLQGHLSDPRHGFLRFAPVPLPLDPNILIVGCVPEECTVFKSSLSPLKITFKTVSGGISNLVDSVSGPGNGEEPEGPKTPSRRRSSSASSHVTNASSSASFSASTITHTDTLTNPTDTYSIMFKAGDDLRQDQLVIQIITLMDQLLRNENLDLKLTPYKILATGPRDGALQFVLNKTLASILAQHNNGILGYLGENNPDPSTPLGVSDQCMDTYVRSCAGYCVITYILGVGDRHLDNLLLSPDGHFFHADFGYILGHDPKPFPPLMKLPIEIISGMGGIGSQNYSKFRALCFTAYTTLRKSAGLILNLFALMSHSTIPDLMVERDDAAVQKVKEKFCLDMSEEEAILHFQNLINDSVNALLPVVIDRLHNLAQYWRA